MMDNTNYYLSRFISAAELSKVMEDLGEQLSQEEVRCAGSITDTGRGTGGSGVNGTV